MELDMEYFLLLLYLVLILFCFVFSLVGIVLNIIVLAVVRQIRSMHTATNYLLPNVALTDLLTLIWPSNFAYLLGPNIDNATGNFYCKFIENFPYVTMSVSALTLTTLAVERYQGLVKPLGSLSSRFKLTKTSALYAIAITWIVALALLTPFLIFTKFNKEKLECQSTMTTFGGVVLVVIFVIATVVIPCVIIAFCYFRIIKGIYFSKDILDVRAASDVAQEEDARMKKKLVTTLVTVTIVFIVCHAPYAVSLITVVVRGENSLGADWLYLVAVFLVYGNSMINPVLYAFPSANYRKGIKRLCRCCK